MRILALSCTHAPYQHENALDFLAERVRALKPDCIVHCGDEIDGHQWSSYSKETAAHGAEKELSLAREWHQRLFRVFGRRPVYVCVSNHGERALRKAKQYGIPSAWIRPNAEVLDAPKTWVWSQEHNIDGIRFIHGEGYSGPNCAMQAAKDSLGACVIGHVHAFAGVQYHNAGRRIIWGMNVGCLIDTEACAFNYAETSRNKAILGCGEIVDGVPHFVPMGV